jgi:hypothetical protein
VVGLKMAPGYPSQAPPLKIHHPIVLTQSSVTRTFSGKNNNFIYWDFSCVLIFSRKPDTVLIPLANP